MARAARQIWELVEHSRPLYAPERGPGRPGLNSSASQVKLRSRLLWRQVRHHIELDGQGAIRQLAGLCSASRRPTPVPGERPGSLSTSSHGAIARRPRPGAQRPSKPRLSAAKAVLQAATRRSHRGGSHQLSRCPTSPPSSSRR